MIDPHHSCSWTSRQATELSLQDGGWVTAGSSLRVILSGLFEPSLRWYSLIDEYNVWIVASELALSEDQPVRADSTDRPIAEAVGDLFQAEEHPLTTSLAEQLGLKPLMRTEPGQEAISFATVLKQIPEIHYLITTHDDCFGYIYPQDEEIGKRLITAILRLHSFYLQQEFDWDFLTPKILEVLQQHQQIRLRAHRSRRQSQIAVEVPQRLWAGKIWPGLEFRPINWIEVLGAQTLWH